MKFSVLNPDYNLSPYTGMTRNHWLEVCEFLLEGVFRHVKSMDEPILMPRNEWEISYPRENGPKWRIAAERFEGLARTFLVAAPYLYNVSHAEVCGYSLRHYYKKQILQSVTKGTNSYLLRLHEIEPEALEGEIAFQHTCECASLVIGLTMCRAVIWDTYTQEEKDRIADYLSEFGHSRTGHHNWRLFNMLILAFLDREGYSIDHGCMIDHSAAIIGYYAGDGWYRDGHLFDYYCPWAFHVYGAFWNQWYGYEKLPKIANKIEEYANELVKTYPLMFDKDAQVLMWGRSGIYRNAVAAPLASNYLLKNPTVVGGHSRRIASGTLLQFITKEECFCNGVPCLGFYGPFKPLVQPYSCAASPFWMANPFLCLTLSEEHPFWSETESNGIWEHKEKKCFVKSTELSGPAIIIDNHLESGITEIRTGKVLMDVNHKSRNAYCRVSFNSQFPWEDFSNKGIEAMQYCLTNNQNNQIFIPNIIMYCGTKDGVLYRKQYFDFESTFQNKASIALADFVVPYGMIRVDRIQIPDKPYTLTLGSYSMPDCERISFSTKISKCGMGIAQIVKSNYGQIALINYYGWDGVQKERRSDLHPITTHSHVLYNTSTRENYYENLPCVMVTGILTRKDGAEWLEEELFPIAEIDFEDDSKCGSFGRIGITMNTNELYTIDFESMEGKYCI